MGTRSGKSKMSDEERSETWSQVYRWMEDLQKICMAQPVDYPKPWTLPMGINEITKEIEKLLFELDYDEERGS